jgi:hypothetical protein
MFTDQLTRAIAAARTPQLDHLSAELWKAYAAGALSDDDAQAAAEAIRERKLASAALREARRLNLVTVQERRRRGQKSLTNLVRIVSPEWTAWIRIGGKKSTTTDNSPEPQTNGRGFGGNWGRHYRHYDPERKIYGRA